MLTYFLAESESPGHKNQRTSRETVVGLFKFRAFRAKWATRASIAGLIAAQLVH